MVVEIPGGDHNHCATVRDFSKLSVRKPLELPCEKLEERYPWGDAIRINATFPVKPKRLLLCSVSVWGSLKIGKCRTGFRLPPPLFFEGSVCLPDLSL